LQPSRKHLPIERYYTLDEFKELRDYGRELGFSWWKAHRWCVPAISPAEQCARSVRVPAIVRECRISE
jgi:lipoic acid synthetase